MTRLAAVVAPSVTLADTGRRFRRLSTFMPFRVSFSFSATLPVAGMVKDFVATTSFRFAAATALTVFSVTRPAWPAVPAELQGEHALCVDLHG